MTYLEAIEPHQYRLSVFERFGNFSGDINEIRQLADIYMTYVYQGKNDTPANLGCTTCKANMFRRLITHRNEQLKLAADTINEFIKKEPTKITVLNVDINSMKWHELKNHAKALGMNIEQGTTKEDILNYLNQ